MRARIVLLLSLFAVVSAAQAADTTRYYNDKDGNAVVWKEGETAIPAFPQRPDLIRFTAPTEAASNQYYVDGKSLILGRDDVLRFTVVIIGSGGAVNVLHQGIDCDSDEIKTYGYGTTAGKMVRSSGANWRPLIRSGPMAYQTILADRYACDADGLSSPVADVLKRLRSPTISDVDVDHDESDSNLSSDFK